MSRVTQFTSLRVVTIAHDYAMELWGQKPWIGMLALLVTSHVTLGKHFHPVRPPSFICQMDYVRTDRSVLVKGHGLGTWQLC